MTGNGLERLIVGAAEVYSARRVVVVEVDGWFGSEWLGFAGKWRGVAGVHRDSAEMPAPPFHVHRVLRERHLVRGEGGGWVEEDAPPVHRDERFEERWRGGGGAGNLHGSRAVERMGAGRMLAWVSRGAGERSLMVYAVTAEGVVAWYVSEDAQGKRRSRGISRGEMELLESRAGGGPLCG